MKLKEFLFPTEINDYKPWITSSTALACFCLAVLGLRLIIPSAVTFAQESMDAGDVMGRINQERESRFIPTLTTNSKLITAAAAKSSDMLARSYFAHVDPDGNYVWPRIVAAGYSPYTTLGENLAMDFSSAGSVVAAWMNSPTHRANIVNSKFQDQGLAAIYGTYEEGYDTIMVTSLFGALLKSSPTPAPAPKTSSPASPPKTTAPQPAPAAPQPAPAAIPQQPAAEPGITSPAPDESIERVAAAPALTAEQTPIRPNPDQLPISAESQLTKLLRLIFSIFAAIYLIFLAADSVIIHRLKIKRTGIHSGPHSLLFLLIVLVNLFFAWA